MDITTSVHMPAPTRPELMRPPIVCRDLAICFKTMVCSRNTMPRSLHGWALNQACEGEEKRWYTSTLELQLASLAMCKACRSVPTWHVRVFSVITPITLLGADICTPSRVQPCVRLIWSGIREVISDGVSLSRGGSCWNIFGWWNHGQIAWSWWFG